MLLKSFISQDEVNELLAWLVPFTTFSETANGSLGYYERLKDLPNVPKIVNKIRNKCLEMTGECLVEPMFEDFIAIVKPNGWINEHTDESKIKGYKHIRFNILLQKPQEGGFLTYEGNPILVEVGDCYILGAWRKHSLTKISGIKSYKTIVFGFLVPNEHMTYI